MSACDYILVEQIEVTFQRPSSGSRSLRAKEGNRTLVLAEICDYDQLFQPSDFFFSYERKIL